MVDHRRATHAPPSKEGNMPESTGDTTRAERSTETPGLKRQWHPPALTVLGDIRSLTDVGGAAAPDSPATSAIS
jgi:hypothetical protein